MNRLLSSRGAVGLRNDLDRARQAIRRLLNSCHGMDIDAMCRRTRLDGDLIRAALEGLMLRGEVDCIKPAVHEGKDKEFFALNRPEGHPWEY